MTSFCFCYDLGTWLVDISEDYTPDHVVLVFAIATGVVVVVLVVM